LEFHEDTNQLDDNHLSTVITVWSCSTPVEQA